MSEKEVKIKEFETTEHYTTMPPARCDLCGDELGEDDDPYRLKFKDGSKAWICDECGEQLMAWGLIPKPSVIIELS